MEEQESGRIKTLQEGGFKVSRVVIYGCPPLLLVYGENRKKIWNTGRWKIVFSFEWPLRTASGRW